MVGFGNKEGSSLDISLINTISVEDINERVPKTAKDGTTTGAMFC